MTSWRFIKSQIVSSTTPLYNCEVEYHIHIGTGTSSNNTVYIPSDQINSDFSDVRFRVNKLFMSYSTVTVSSIHKIFYVKVPYIYDGTTIDILHGLSDTNSWESPYNTYTYYDNIYDANRITIESGSTYMDYNNNQLSIIGTPTGLAHTTESFTINNKVITIYAAIPNDLNSAIQFLSGGNLIAFRRNASNYIIAEYNMDQSSNISLSIGITKFTIICTQNTITYLINDSQVYTHSLSDSFNSSIRFLPASNGIIIIDSIHIKQNNTITHGVFTTYDESNYFMLPFDQQCFIKTLPYDEFPTNMDISYNSFNSYATTTLNPESFTVFTNGSTIDLTGEYTYLHNNISSITAWILPNTDPYPFVILDTGKYTINITSDKKLNVVLRNDSNVTLVDYTVTAPFESYNWSFFGIVNAYPSMTIYTYTHETELEKATVTYSSTPPSSSCNSIKIGSSQSGYNAYNGLLNALSIENEQLMDYDMIDAGCFATSDLDPIVPTDE